jgi:protein O-GlcNAc transferase
VRDAERRLRVGYVSPDFREHPVTTFFEPVLAGHDREKFEVFCYSHPLRVDAVTERLRGMADQWREIGNLSDEQAVERIRADGVDVLVDLAGHTAGNRLGIFARRAAPVQVSYLGYIGTTGLPAMGHRVGDGVTEPAGTEAFYTERVVRVEGPFACYRAPGGAPDVGELPAGRNGFVTFGSFNALGKIPDDLLTLWAMILRAVPGSRLVMAAVGLGDPAAQRRIRGFFEGRQIAAERVEMQGFRALPEYLAMHQRVDILLDTFPVNGHTVSCHALYMGVPVVTMAGAAYASRLGASVLEAVGLTELVAANGEEYVLKAVGLAKDLVRLGGMRKSLRERMGVVMDQAGIVGALEEGYRRMWREWCEVAGRSGS